MISCTEFPPAYSEIFSFLEENYGKEWVHRFWEFLFDPNGRGIPLIGFLQREGIKGCFSYWNGTLNEEAADFSMYLNEKDGWFKIEMHHCPSKGRLLEYKDRMGFVPYHDYCLHCDHYRESIEKIGLDYVYDFCGQDRASCSILVSDPKTFTKKLIIDEDTVQIHRNASDNEYFHKDFHSSLNLGIKFIGDNFGEDAVKNYLVKLTHNIYRPEIENIKQKGIEGIKERLLDLYKKEKAEDALKISEKDGTTTVEIAYCPAVRHIQSIGKTVCDNFYLTSKVIMEEFARIAGVSFTWEEYDAETGKARYSFN